MIDWKTICTGCGDCCGPVPFTLEHWERVSSRVVTVPDDLVDLIGTAVIPLRNDSLECIFLTPDRRCAIYNDRPEVCRLQGTISELPCPRI